MIKNNRYIIIKYVIIFSFFIITIKLFDIQIVNQELKKYAKNNVIRKKIFQPNRGLIYDRNNQLLVYNQIEYEIYFVKDKIEKFDTTLLAHLIKKEKIYIKNKIEKTKNNFPQLIASKIDEENFGPIQESLFMFPGFYSEKKINRKYNYKYAAHTLGYIREVNENEIKNDSNSFYQAKDVIGANGIEKLYENQLRGEKGSELILVDANNIEQEKYRGGLLDVPSLKGKDIITTIDINLQQYAEELMYGKKGSVIAIEPISGEILAIGSFPSYDPNLLTGLNRSENYNKLIKDKNKPLFNRSIQGEYPPGSTFKTINSIIGLDYGLNPNKKYKCNYGFMFTKKNKLKCHEHKSPINLEEAIATSCNSYFCYMFKEIVNDNYVDSTFNEWKEKVNLFGLGVQDKSNLLNTRKGFVPNSDYYNKIYGFKNWKSSTVISLAIGQGELLATPLQLCNIACIIANKGHYISPHIAKKIENQNLNKDRLKNTINFNKDYFDIIEKGMRSAFTNKKMGSCQHIEMPNLQQCGKTGTTQNPHGEDHSMFIGYAPLEKPQIAISVIVEEGGWGAQWAAPIASLLMEKYLNGYVLRKELSEYICKTKINE